MLDVDPATPRRKGTPTPTQFLAHVYCGQMAGAGWMKTPLGTEVDLGSGHIVPDGSQLPQKGHSTPPLFSAHVYCGHGRPSQLLLGSCTNGRPKTAELIEMPFGLWTRMGRRNHVLDGAQIPYAKGQLLGKGHARRHSAVSCTTSANQ